MAPQFAWALFDDIVDESESSNQQGLLNDGTGRQAGQAFRQFDDGAASTFALAGFNAANNSGSEQFTAVHRTTLAIPVAERSGIRSSPGRPAGERRP